MTVLKFPDEILVEIAQNLPDSKSVKSFTETCQRFKSISYHPLLWKRLVKKQFFQRYRAELDKEEPKWFEAFKEEASKKQRKKEIFRPAPLYHFIDPPLSWIHFFDI